MKYCKYCIPAFLLLAVAGAYAMPGVTSGPGPAGASAELQTKGAVQVLIVVGEVKLTGADGQASALYRGEVFAEGGTVSVGRGGSALMVLSNGATLKLKEGMEMTLVKFRQAPFDQTREETYLRLIRDPSRSNVEIKINQNTLQGEVKNLNTAAGSTFDVITPKGTIHVRDNGGFNLPADGAAEKAPDGTNSTPAA